MTDNDKMFLQTVQRISRDNRENPDQSQALVTNKALLSTELLKVLDVEGGALGAWVFNVYVEFEPMFRSRVAKDWQK